MRNIAEPVCRWQQGRGLALPCCLGRSEPALLCMAARWIFHLTGLPGKSVSRKFLLSQFLWVSFSYLLALLRWRIAGVRTGVRALPPRDQHGSLPLAGRVDGEDNLWVVGGLGARGLVYHAWLGDVMAQAVLSGDEGIIPEQLRRWQA